MSKKYTGIVLRSSRLSEARRLLASLLSEARRGASLQRWIRGKESAVGGKDRCQAKYRYFSFLKGAFRWVNISCLSMVNSSIAARAKALTTLVRPVVNRLRRFPKVL